MKLFFIIISLLSVYQITLNAQETTSILDGSPVYPGVSGLGFNTKGGQGGKIIRVTTLEAEGEGSFAEAIKVTGPVIIVFEVGGIIDLDSKTLSFQKPYVTVAGQTAPFPGITFIRGGLEVNTHDVIIQHIKVRPGEAGKPKKSGWEMDGITTINNSYNVIIDHCSVSWATDENISASGPQFKGSDVDEWRKNTSHNIVISNCIIAEGLANSTHSKGEHSKGSLIHDNVTGIVFLGNLFISNSDRNPFFAGGSNGLILNNYIYNPGFSAIKYALSSQEWGKREWVTGILDIEGNVIEAGPDTHNTMPAVSFLGLVDVFWNDNLLLAGPESKEMTGSFTLLGKRPFWPEGLSIIPADEVRKYVLSNAGAFPWERDETDQRIVNSIDSRTAKIIDSEQEAGGYPSQKPVMKKFNENEWDLVTLSRKTKSLP